ncbi:MAG TPA: glycosyltransferase [Patescibacteria group bacterium]|nr:glycosyltransferase [Patescibacteria group bacterium]
MRATYLLVTTLYPSEGDLYRYPFVHKRVLAYRACGIEVDVFRPGFDHEHVHHFEGVACHSGSYDDLAKRLSHPQYKAVLVHGLNADLWKAMAPHLAGRSVYAWIHGTEIIDFARIARDYAEGSERETAAAQFRERLEFWRRLLRARPSELKLVFVSRLAAQAAMDALGFELPLDAYSIIHNPIDTVQFAYHNKPQSQRFRVLSIRPYSRSSYGNDIAVRTVLELAKRRFFRDMTFTFMGDGKLFDETLDPLRHLSNVAIKKSFLRHHEIAHLHRSHGIFLVPSRLDTQGVSRDEAMSSGLVPATNSVGAIPEFVDDSCGVLAPPEDHMALVEGIERLIGDPDLFESMSAAAAARVRFQSSAEKIIPQEIALFSASNAISRLAS